MGPPVKARIGSIRRNEDQSDSRRGWVVSLDIQWLSDVHDLFRAVEVCGGSPDEVKARAEWVLGAIHTAMEEGWP